MSGFGAPGSRRPASAPPSVETEDGFIMERVPLRVHVAGAPYKTGNLLKSQKSGAGQGVNESDEEGDTASGVEGMPSSSRLVRRELQVHTAIPRRASSGSKGQGGMGRQTADRQSPIASGGQSPPGGRSQRFPSDSSGYTSDPGTSGRTSPQRGGSGTGGPFRLVRVPLEVHEAIPIDPASDSSQRGRSGSGYPSGSQRGSGYPSGSQRGSGHPSGGSQRSSGRTSPQRAGSEGGGPYRLVRVPLEVHEAIPIGSPTTSGQRGRSGSGYPSGSQRGSGYPSGGSQRGRSGTGSSSASGSSAASIQGAAYDDSGHTLTRIDLEVHEAIPIPGTGAGRQPAAAASSRTGAGSRGSGPTGSSGSSGSTGSSGSPQRGSPTSQGEDVVAGPDERGHYLVRIKMEEHVAIPITDSQSSRSGSQSQAARGGSPTRGSSSQGGSPTRGSSSQGGSPTRGSIAEGYPRSSRSSPASSQTASPESQEYELRRIPLEVHEAIPITSGQGSPEKAGVPAAVPERTGSRRFPSMSSSGYGSGGSFSDPNSGAATPILMDPPEGAGGSPGKSGGSPGRSSSPSGSGSGSKSSGSPPGSPGGKKILSQEIRRHEEELVQGAPGPSGAEGGSPHPASPSPSRGGRKRRRRSKRPKSGSNRKSRSRTRQKGKSRSRSHARSRKSRSRSRSKTRSRRSVSKKSRGSRKRKVRVTKSIVRIHRSVSARRRSSVRRSKTRRSKSRRGPKRTKRSKTTRKRRPPTRRAHQPRKRRGAKKRAARRSTPRRSGGGGPRRGGGGGSSSAAGSASAATRVSDFYSSTSTTSA